MWAGAHGAQVKIRRRGQKVPHIFQITARWNWSRLITKAVASDEWVVGRKNEKFLLVSGTKRRARELRGALRLARFWGVVPIRWMTLILGRNPQECVLHKNRACVLRPLRRDICM